MNIPAINHLEDSDLNCLQRNPVTMTADLFFREVQV